MEQIQLLLTQAHYRIWLGSTHTKFLSEEGESKKKKGDGDPAAAAVVVAGVAVERGAESEPWP